MKTIGMYKYNSSQVYNNKNIKTARYKKHTVKKELEKAIKTKNNTEIKIISIESHKKI